jgi:hypothetical protein
MNIIEIINSISNKRWADSEPIFRDDCNWQYNLCQLSDKADAMGISLFSEIPDEDEVSSWVDESVPLLDAWVQVCTWSIKDVGIEFIRHLESISSIDELKSAIKQAYDKEAMNLVKFMMALLCKAESETKEEAEYVETESVETEAENDTVLEKGVTVDMNIKGREMVNRASLCEMLETAYNNNELVDTGSVYCLLDSNRQPVVELDKATGEFLHTQAGKNKSNKRQYVSLPLVCNKSYMCSNYTFRVIVEGLLSNNNKHQERYKEFKEGRYAYRLYTKEECIEKGFNPKEGMMGPAYDPTDINHINGNSLDNRDCNIEVDTKAMNMAHARFMAEVHQYYPELVSEDTDCQGNKMHVWTDGVGVTCSQIRDWNSENPKDAIKAFKDKKGEWTSRLTKEQVTKMLAYFGKI